MLKRILGLFVILFFTSGVAAAQKSKKAYELIYEDIQVLKQQFLRLDKKIDQNLESLKSIEDKIQAIETQLRVFQAEQAKTQEGLKDIPSQYQILSEKIELINFQLTKISEQLLTLKSTVPPVSELETNAAKKEEKSRGQKGAQSEKEEEPLKEKAAIISTPSLSPQEVFNTAYSDYQKGNFDLAIDGFKTYSEQFPTSPLADNALYMIGECYFSQKKYNEAIDQFNDLILNYPQGDKMAAAYLKKGICCIELKKKDEAIAVFKLLITKYPLEEETKIAQQKIKELLEGK